MRFGFAKSDITPRVGVELCGFGPFVLRHSVGVREPLWARAMAVEHDGDRMVVVSCDLIGSTPTITGEVRRIVNEATGLPAEAVMVHCTHTHSGPSVGAYIGWGEADAAYLELLPGRIAKACCDAIANLQEATLSHAVVPCEGVGINREYDQATPSLEAALDESWRPTKPELTDTTCHVLRVDADGKTIGFASYFGCHPVVCCAQTRYIHGDYCGVATNMLEREHPGAVGLFLQGAQGDVNTCVVHKPEEESLRALQVIAARYARAVRAGLAAAQPVEVDSITYALCEATFTRKPWGRDKLESMLAEQEATIATSGATEEDADVRRAIVVVLALRQLLAKLDAGESLEPATEVHGMRIGPVAMLGAPFEIFQAIKNDVVARANASTPLVMGLTNDDIGYAPDRTKAAEGGYAADFVPLICGGLPFASIHDELVEAMLHLDAELV